MPRDLTDATSTGGLISLFCALLMAYLFVSNIAEYLKVQSNTDVALDDTGEVHMRIFFNITMVRRAALARSGWPAASSAAVTMPRRSGCRASLRRSTSRTSWALR